MAPKKTSEYFGKMVYADTEEVLFRFHPSQCWPNIHLYSSFFHIQFCGFVMELVSGLPNLLPGGIINVDFSKWTHLDFLWGMDAKPLVYDYVITMMNSIP